MTALHHEWATVVGTGGCAHTIAVDIAGAFDKVSHAGVLHKAAALGVAGQLHTWLQNYLHNRSLSVVLNGQQSVQYAVNTGVPQGSILGPTLFLVYVNDTELCLSGATAMGGFADDTTLYSVLSSCEAFQLSMADFQLSMADFQLSMADFQLSMADFQLSMADFQLLMADFQLSVADFQLLMADFQLLMADFQLSLSGPAA